jgi:hypothetical protein
MTSYIDQIDAQLAQLRMEIERLQIARDVISGLDGRGSKPVLTLKAEKPQKDEPITIRRIGAPEEKAEKPKKKSQVGRKIDTQRGPKARKEIMALIREGGAMSAKDLIDWFGYTDQRDKQLVYNTVSKFHLDGVMVKDEEGRFSLPEQAVAAE